MKIDFTEDELLLIQDAIIYERDYHMNLSHSKWLSCAGSILLKIDKEI